MQHQIRNAKQTSRTMELLRRRPSRDPEAYQRLADHMLQQGQLQDAIAVCELMVTQFPKQPQPHLNLANLYYSQHRYAEALPHFQWLIEKLDPTADRHDMLGICYFNGEQYSEARFHLQQAVNLAPHHGPYHEHLAQALYRSEHLSLALASIRRAIQLQPQEPSYHYCLGFILRENGEFGAATEAFQQALSLKPDYRSARWHLCHLRLLQGQFMEGWRTDDWWRCGLDSATAPPYDSAVAWDGMSYGGQTLLVQWHRGYGDNFQCLRYVPALKALGGTVLVEAPAEVQDLLIRDPDIDQVVPLTSDHNCSVHYDHVVSMLDLPKIFCTTASDIPSRTPYLRAPKDRIRTWRDRIVSDLLKVGFVWAGDPTHGNDHHRSCPLSCFKPLLEMSGVQWYSLQKGKAATALRTQHVHSNVIDLGSQFKDFSDTAAAIHHMDLIISVDTSVLHLAGALGKQAWGLINFVPDWRWQLERSDCPWYPTIHLMRQTKRVDWQELIDRVARKLRGHVSV